MDLTRRSGVLLHPTSLPGPFGRGDLGPAAYAFVDQLARAGQAAWQILPLGPPGFGGSPYAASSAFAGDPMLLSPVLLVEDDLIEASELTSSLTFATGQVDPRAEGWRRQLVTKAARGFVERADRELREELEAFRAEQAYWLDDYTLFAALKAAHRFGAFWASWPEALVRAEPDAVRRARREHAPAIRRELIAQFLFDRQWRRLRAYAHERGVQIIGDVPIFVARDSADAWSRPELFELDDEGEPTVVAGVPPDGFSKDGQLWGNPLYRWPVHEYTDYAWWVERMRTSLAQVDVVRIDHFRGFAGYYEIQGDAETARDGRWVRGPGRALFHAIKTELGDAQVIAEDLGFVDAPVLSLLRYTGFPGMKILQFAYGDDDPEHSFRPENHPVDCVVYTGTHDNQTTRSWLADADELTQARVLERVGEEDPVWGLIDAAWSSKAFLAIVPVQDLLDLDDSARMNHPGTDEGNWAWRLEDGQLTDEVLDRLRALTELYDRLVPKG